MAIAVLVPVALYLSPAKMQPPAPNVNSDFGYFNGSKSTVQNPRPDAVLIPIYQTPIVPKVHGFDHITYASVEMLNPSMLLFTTGLAGDPNQNDIYETSYRWHILSSNKQLTEQEYTVIIPNFANDSSFGPKGWYYAIFNNTSNTYVVPLKKTEMAQHDKVALAVNATDLGNPIRFYYSVTVGARVNSTSFDHGPDYLMDVTP